MEDLSTVEIMLVGTKFSGGKNKGRLLDTVSGRHILRFTRSNFGSWVEINLTEQQADQAMKGSSVAILNLNSMEVIEMVSSQTCHEKILRLSPNSEAD